MMLLQSLTDMLVPVVPGVRNRKLGIEMLQPDLVHECVQLPVAVSSSSSTPQGKRWMWGRGRPKQSPRS